MSKLLHHAPIVILVVGLLVPAGLAAQDIVYTGCIKSGDGSLYSVREGTTPMATCKAKDNQISWNMAGQPGPPGPPLDITVNVDCDQGESINAALVQQAERLTISITGTCVEFVVITRDDVTLQGVDPPPTITAPPGEWSSAVSIAGAHGVILTNLHLAGGSSTLAVERFASLAAWNVQITGGSNSGLSLTDSSAILSQCEISQNEIGASVGSGSTLILEDSKVIDNRNNGFSVGGELSLRRTEVARNRSGIYVGLGRVEASGGADCAIRDNPDYGVSLNGGRLILDGCLVEGSYTGVEALYGSFAQLNDATIQGSTWAGVSAAGGSSILLSAATAINGGSAVGIYLGDTSTLGWVETPTVTGDLWGIYCAGPPSVAQLTSPFPGVDTNCLAGE